MKYLPHFLCRVPHLIAGIAIVACLASQSWGSLLASYTFDDGTTLDQSGNGNHATNFGATLTTDRFGNSNQAYLFNGSSNYMQTPVNGNLYPVSFSVWFRADSSSGGEQSIVDSDVAGRFGQSLIIDYALSPPSTGNLDVQFHNGASDTGAEGNVTVGRWHHAVVNFSTNIEVYLDNDLIFTQAYSPAALDGSNFRLGRHNAGDPQFFQGAIDDVRFYDMVLTAEDVDRLFNESSSVVPEPSSIVLFGLGAIGLLAYGARRRKMA